MVPGNRPGIVTDFVMKWTADADLRRPHELHRPRHQEHPRHRPPSRGRPGLIEQHGGQFRQLLWTLGQYDQVAIVDFPEDETATAVLLQIGALGNIRTTTMKAFDAEQMSAIIQRTG
jgi:hypothetical protein